MAWLEEGMHESVLDKALLNFCFATSSDLTMQQYNTSCHGV